MKKEKLQNRLEGDFLEIEILESEKNSAEFVIKGERHSFPSLLKDVLSRDSSVEFVSYTLEHPLDADSKFFLKTKGKTAKKALEDALSQLEKDFKEFKSAFSSAGK